MEIDQVNLIDNLKMMNETMIIYLKKIHKNTKINELISEILKDEACFFKMKKEEAYKILKYIGINDNKITEVYYSLTSNNKRIELKKNGKLNDEDDLSYNVNKLFKKDEIKNEADDKKQMVKTKNSIFKKIIWKIKKMMSKHYGN